MSCSYRIRFVLLGNKSAVLLSKLFGRDGCKELLETLKQPSEQNRWQNKGTAISGENVYELTIPAKMLPAGLTSYGASNAKIRLTFNEFTARIEKPVEYLIPEGHTLRQLPEVTKSLDRICNREVNMLFANAIANRLRAQVQKCVGMRLAHKVEHKVGLELRQRIAVRADNIYHVQQIRALMSKM
jgi:hypothetical protein